MVPGWYLEEFHSSELTIVRVKETCKTTFILKGTLNLLWASTNKVYRSIVYTAVDWRKSPTDSEVTVSHK